MFLMSQKPGRKSAQKDRSMSNHLSTFWHWYIVIGTVISILGCGVLLKMQTTKRLAKGEEAELHGHVWDEDLCEYNNPLPNWWKWLFYITIIFSFGYLAFYPGLGNFAGRFAWSSEGQYRAEIADADAAFGPIFAKYMAVDIPALARDPEATAIGQRLFLNYCAQCHGSDAAGGKGFPNLTDKDWLYGGDPATITASILHGRNGVMPPQGAMLGPQGVTEVTHFVRALAGLTHDPALAANGKNKFAVCAACHGVEGKGNRAMGAPNLTDNIWLYGSSEETIAETIAQGRMNAMPPQEERLGAAKVHLLAAYVYSLGGGEPAVSAAAESSLAASVAAPGK